MVETKYGKYVMREPHARFWPDVPIYVNSLLNDRIRIDLAIKPQLEVGPGDPLAHKAHKHNVDELLFFIGSDPMNLMDLQGEVELSLGWGKDQETHTFNTTTFVYIPKGLVHLPWNFKRVDKPILVGHILLAPQLNENNTQPPEP
jgi:hypothetical protein